jgi:hypothetical protein
MALPLELSNKILKILTLDHTKSYTLEELTSIININSCELSDSKALEREIQALVLDTLIFLESDGLIFLDPLTDKSQIKIKKNIS